MVEMSDETPTETAQSTTDEPPTADDDASGVDRLREPTPEPTDEEESENREFAERMRRYLDYAVLAGLLLLALIAALQFYLNASQTITTWVNPEYRAPFQAAFNLVLLLGAALGVSVQLRRLASD
ncbi:hypothetical protein DEQ92_09875 [Haloferax sp. Atlit-6N]|uniref:DUF8060 domain-containing protein n=1 Tax=Haloferax gibbonsii (strain ATCC 33959 / DSM 4427 / JCM 8863 / NBRC 102184 / NCIMB 2188 / Ma 2.38) TaxID=1227459 RepID=M0H9T9_HALGM|nr:MULTISPECIES: hypothetical protein [Haloferax]ELZ81326.1 hypothetical protein C454_09781 [Haloferax gibbonsii ATCC 33959]REA03433.1 hypothetical protein DEQ92_09875 [Haloferax sp. Atlit-6N]